MQNAIVSSCWRVLGGSKRGSEVFDLQGNNAASFGFEGLRRDVLSTEKGLGVIVEAKKVLCFEE